MTGHGNAEMEKVSRGRVRVTIPLPFGSSYTLDIAEENLGPLATGILSRLGCSYEIKWPGHEGGWGSQAEVLRQVQEEATDYAHGEVLRLHPWLTDELLRERMEEALRKAFLRGWHHSPKPVTFPVARHRGE